MAPAFTDAAAVVRALGAVQAQDYDGARWAVAQRTTGLTCVDVEAAIACGAILRTHVLRPTWHFVLPEDARWLLELTAPRVLAAMAYYNRILELDARAFRKSRGVIERALRDGRHLTRGELRAALERAGMNVTSGQRVGHLLMQAELEGVIISGARRGKQLTYALFDLRVPAAPPRSRDDALHELTRRYFATRGPATLQDFAWWSGLTVADAKRGVDAAAGFVRRETHDGGTYWSVRSARASHRSSRVAHLLPAYDEFFIGFKDRSAFAERLRRVRSKGAMNALPGRVLCLDGQVVGGWRRTLGKTVEVALDLLVPLTTVERRLAGQAVEHFGEFLGTPVQVRRLTSRRMRTPFTSATPRSSRSATRPRPRTTSRRRSVPRRRARPRSALARSAGRARRRRRR